MPKLRYFAVAVLALITTGSPAFAESALPDSIFGKFRGAVSGTSSELAGEFTVSIQRSDVGFTVAWPPRIEAEFGPAGRPGVFRTDGDYPVLEGTPVYWARFAENGLTVYSMQIGEHGGYHIDSYVYTPVGNGLDLVIRHVRTGAEPRLSKGRLERYDG